ALAYLRALPGLGAGHELRTINLDGTNDIAVVHAVAGRALASPRWSPDGKHIYYLSSDSLYAVEIDGGEVIPITRAGLGLDSFDLPLGAERLVAAQHWLPRNCGVPSSVEFTRIMLRDTLILNTEPAFWHTNSDFLDP